MLNTKIRNGCLSLCTLAALTLFAFAAKAEDNVVKLASLEWPPFAGEKLADNGASAAVVKAAYEAIGYKVVIEFLPWNRAVQMAKSDPSFAGYFPEYDSESVRADFQMSAPIGSSPLGFAERVDNKISWTALADLKSYTIGVVDGYVNTAEFDKMVADKALNAEVNVDDTTNLRKLAAGRVDLSVVDQNVMNYLLKNEMQAEAAKLAFNGHVLEDKQLFIAFRKDEAGSHMSDVLKQGLAKIDPKSIMDAYLAK